MRWINKKKRGGGIREVGELKELGGGSDGLQGLHVVVLVMMKMTEGGGGESNPTQPSRSQGGT